MSYSFGVNASTKDEAKAKVTQEFEAIVLQQPNHSKDEAQALANASEAIDLLRDDETQDIRVECYGSLMWSTDPEQITGVTLHAYACLVAKAA
jgi:hypothetical protein